MKNLFENERFRRASEIVRKRANGYCVDQSRANDSFVWEMWSVGTTFVMITAKATAKDVLVEVWSPVTSSIDWESVEQAVDAIRLRPRAVTITWESELVAVLGRTVNELEIADRFKFGLVNQEVLEEARELLKKVKADDDNDKN